MEKPINLRQTITRGKFISVIVILIIVIGIVAVIAVRLYRMQDFKNFSNCAKAGETIGGVPSERSKNCCAGLNELTISRVLLNGRCDPAGGASLCSDCGNGVCESWENKCNCPKDCNI